jgi:hypothetical protein
MEMVPSHVRDMEGRDVYLCVDGNSRALIFKDSERPIGVLVCGACGCVELHATDAPNPLAAWRRSQQHTS